VLVSVACRPGDLLVLAAAGHRARAGYRGGLRPAPARRPFARGQSWRFCRSSQVIQRHAGRCGSLWQVAVGYVSV